MTDEFLPGEARPPHRDPVTPEQREAFRRTARPVRTAQDGARRGREPGEAATERLTFDNQTVMDLAVGLVRLGIDAEGGTAVAILDIIRPHVAALVAAAEERGAAKERERAQGEMNELRRTIRSINDAREQDRADADNGRGGCR